MMPVSSHGMAPQMPGGMVPIGNSLPPGGEYKVEAMSNPYGDCLPRPNKLDVWCLARQVW